MTADRHANARRAVAMLAGPVGRLESSLSEDAEHFPLDAKSVLTVDSKTIDAFLQRYQQVADLLLRKAMPRLLSAIEERDERLRFRDMLDELERYGVIESADQFSDINEQRNRLVHEYAMEPSARAAELNLAWAFAPVLIESVQSCTRYLDEGPSR